ncbi:MAG: hypothetical protein J1F61_00825 [Clostridiales bacterium]|nr:hypothetical protein [Clostridiales bacterium]
MKEENKKCWSCGRFQRYYTKGYGNLHKEDIGFCTSQNKIVCKDEGCKMWNYRQKVRNMRKQMAISSIVDICSKLEVIKHILTEERELEKVKNEKY